MSTDVFLGFWDHFHFIRPLWLFALVPMLFTVWRVNQSSATPDHWHRFIAPHLIPHLLVGSETKRKIRPANLFALVSLLTVVAVAGPTWQRKISPLAEDSASLTVILDLSATMAQGDVQPSRSERAKLKIRDILRLRPSGRTALVVYAGSAHVVTPLTNDPQVVKNLVSSLKAGMMPVKGKSLTEAYHLANQTMTESLVPGTIILISDGPGQASLDQLTEACRTSRHSLLVHGIGNPENTGTNLASDWGGLEQLASDCGGRFVPMSHDDEDVRALVNQVNLNFIASGDEDAEWIDFGYYLMFPVMVLFLFWFRPGWTLKFAIAPLFVMQVTQAEAREWSFLDLWMTADQQGHYYFEQGDFAKAAGLFEDPEWKATALYMQEDFKAAADIFGLISTPEGYFKLGNALAHGRHYVAAAKAYDRCLELKPGFPGAAENRDRLQAIMDEINAVSAAQAAEESDDKMEAGDDVPRTAEGAERETSGEYEREELSAEEILNDPAINDLWMKRVQPDPSRFLQMKFRRQLDAQEEGGS